jgi:hypothetical protein
VRFFFATCQPFHEHLKQTAPISVERREEMASELRKSIYSQKVTPCSHIARSTRPACPRGPVTQQNLILKDHLEFS